MYEINLFKIDVLLEKIVFEMMEKELYLECVNLFVLFLFLDKDIWIVFFLKMEEGIFFIELLVLEVLIKVC